MDPARVVSHQPIRGLTRAEYVALAEQGVFRDERVELMFGQVVRMSPIGPPHNESVVELTQRLVLAFQGQARVRCQMSFAASDDSQPEPDFAITSLTPNWRELPSTSQLVIEVSERSLRYDLHEKARLYAEIGIDEYWVVDLVHEVVHVHREPLGTRWRSLTVHNRGEVLVPLRFPSVTIDVAGILPPR